MKPKKPKAPKPKCRKCKDTGRIPIPVSKLSPGQLRGSAVICLCPEGKILHDAWQGLYTPGN